MTFGHEDLTKLIRNSSSIMTARIFIYSFHERLELILIFRVYGKVFFKGESFHTKILVLCIWVKT